MCCLVSGTYLVTVRISSNGRCSTHVSCLTSHITPLILAFCQWIVPTSLCIQLTPTISKNKIVGDSGLLGCDAGRVDPDVSKDHSAVMFRVQQS